MKVNNFLLVLCLFITASTMAQTRKIDSIQAKLAAAPPDTSKVMLLARLAEYLYTTKPDTSLLISQQGLELARKINYKKGEAECLLMISVRFEKAGNYLKKMQFVKQALAISLRSNLYPFPRFKKSRSTGKRSPDRIGIGKSTCKSNGHAKLRIVKRKIVFLNTCLKIRFLKMLPKKANKLY